jgi:hypothetical protein
MAGFTSTLRGDGLAKAQSALAGLEGNPLELDRARRQFRDSPLPDASDPSGTTTRSASPDPPSEEQQHREERQWQLIREHRASLPREQFDTQIDEEMKQVWKRDPNTNLIHQMPIGGSLEESAREIVKKRWIEQGIWNKKWNDVYITGRWKHEEPLVESESETDSEVESLIRPFSFGMFLSRYSLNENGQRGMRRLRSGESYGSVNVKPPVHIISLSIRYRKSGNDSKMNQGVGKV